MRQVHQVIKTNEDTNIKTQLRQLLITFYASWLLFILSGAACMWLVIHGYAR